MTIYIKCLKNLPLQPVSFKRNLQVVNNFENMWTQQLEDAAPAYQNALDHSNFSHKLEYTPHETQRPRRNRQRNVIWFNPPFSKNVKINIARSFLHLVDTHFPAGHKLHKIFNIGTQLRSVTVV